MKTTTYDLSYSISETDPKFKKFPLSIEEADNPRGYILKLNKEATLKSISVRMVLNGSLILYILDENRMLVSKFESQKIVENDCKWIELNYINQILKNMYSICCFYLGIGSCCYHINDSNFRRVNDNCEVKSMYIGQGSNPLEMNKIYIIGDNSYSLMIKLNLEEEIKKML